MYFNEDKRALFIGVSCSGSTAIGHELESKYNFIQIAHKHCNYMYFKKYLVSKFGVPKSVMLVQRSPVDKAMSEYIKLINNHRGHLTRPELRVEAGGHVSAKMVKLHSKLIEAGACFEEYLLERYRIMGYYDDLLYNLSDATHIIDFSHIGRDFKRSMIDMGFPNVDDLPLRNKTLKNTELTLSNELKYKIFSNYENAVLSYDSGGLCISGGIRGVLYALYTHVLSKRRLMIEHRLYLNWLESSSN